MTARYIKFARQYEKTHAQLMADVAQRRIEQIVDDARDEWNEKQARHRQDRESFQTERGIMIRILVATMTGIVGTAWIFLFSLALAIEFGLFAQVAGVIP